MREDFLALDLKADVRKGLKRVLLKKSFSAKKWPRLKNDCLIKMSSMEERYEMNRTRQTSKISLS